MYCIYIYIYICTSVEPWCSAGPGCGFDTVKSDYSRTFALSISVCTYTSLWICVCLYLSTHVSYTPPFGLKGFPLGPSRLIFCWLLLFVVCPLLLLFVLCCCCLLFVLCCCCCLSFVVCCLSFVVGPLRLSFCCCLLFVLCCCCCLSVVVVGCVVLSRPCWFLSMSFLIASCSSALSLLPPCVLLDLLPPTILIIAFLAVLLSCNACRTPRRVSRSIRARRRR